MDAPVVAITHAKLIDGSGGPATNDQTIVIRGEKIVAVGRRRASPLPAGARVIDATGKTIIPG